MFHSIFCGFSAFGPQAPQARFPLRAIPTARAAVLRSLPRSLALQNAYVKSNPAPTFVSNTDEAWLSGNTTYGAKPHFSFLSSAISSPTFIVLMYLSTLNS